MSVMNHKRTATFYHFFHSGVMPLFTLAGSRDIHVTFFHFFYFKIGNNNNNVIIVNLEKSFRMSKQILHSLNNVRTLYGDSNQILYSLNNVRTLYSDSKQILYSLNNVRTLYSDNKQILYKSNSVRTLFFYSDSRHQIKMGYRSKFSGADHPSVKVRGGPGRNHEVVMELQLTKVYCIYLYHPILITPFPHLLQ